MKGKAKKLIILFVIAVLTALMAAVASYSYAIIGFTIEENYEAEGATNYFTLDTGVYYKTHSLTVGQTSMAVTVRNNIVNSHNTNPYFDLLVYLPDGATAAIPTKTPLVKEISEGKVYIFRNMVHTSPAVTADMNVEITLTGILSADTAKIVALTSDESNEYISDFFDLRMLNDEINHNIYYEDAFGSWERKISTTYTISENTINVADIGIVINKDDTQSTYLTGTLSNDGNTVSFSFKSLTATNGFTLAGANTFVFYYDGEFYYNEAYGLRLSIAEGNFGMDSLPYVGFGSSSHLYFLDDIIIDREYTLNIPCHIDLLYANLILQENFTIEHHYGGSFNFTAIDKGIDSILNDTAVLNIATPRGYFVTRDVDNLISFPANFIKESEAVDFTMPENADLFSAMITDAKDFINGYIPERIRGNIHFYEKYHTYGVSYSYTVNSSYISVNGIVSRGTSTTATTIYVDVYYNGIKQGETLEKTVYVVGTSDQAVADELCYATQMYLNSISVMSEGIQYFTQSAEIINLYIKAIDELGISERFSLQKSTNLNFIVNYDNSAVFTTVTADRIDFLPADNRVMAFYNDVNLVSVDISDIYSIYIAKPTIILTDSVENILLKYEYTNNSYESSANITVNIKGMSFAEKTNYLERYLETLYITSANESHNVLQLSSDGFYRGNLIDGDRVIPSTLGCSGFSYSIYAVSEVLYQSYSNGDITLTELITAQTSIDSTAAFSVDDGVITVSSVSVDNGFCLAVLATAEFLGGAVGETEYNLVRRVIIPADGIGGSEYIQYTRGDTFTEYFNGLENGMLIDSTANDGLTIGSGYIFASFDAAVLLEMSIVNASDVINGENTFCSLVRSATGNYYQIAIDIDNIPASNTVVSLAVRFYLSDNTTISEQSYTFIIPGIYKQGRDVANIAIYKRMLEEYDNYNNEYLLVDGASAAKDLFDCSLITLTGVTSTDVIDLGGIEKLTKTASMKFDGVKIASLAPFAAFNNDYLTELSLNNCQITDEIIMATTNGQMNTYYLNRLITVRLNGNGITSLVDGNGNPYLYRTVQNLYISDQRNGESRCLSGIEGIKKLSGLKTLDVSGNAVAEFLPLTECTKLMAVDFSDNIATEFAGKLTADDKIYYGSTGLINIPVFVTLSDKGVILTGDSANVFTTEQRISALAINAVNYMNTQYDRITVPSKTFAYATGGETEYAITTVYVLENNATVIFTSASVINSDETVVLTSSDFANNDIIKIILSITIDGITVYRQIQVNFKETTT